MKTGFYKHILMAACYTLAFMVFLGLFLTRFIDPKLTDTELLLHYWWIYITGLPAGFALIWLAQEIRLRK